MSNHQARLWLIVLICFTMLAPAGMSYIHFPPMTLKKMCQFSHHIHVLKVDKFSKDKGVILFEPAAILKGRNSQCETTKHVLRAGAEGSKPILDWLAEGKIAVMFYIEGAGAGLGCGYVFIDRYCYSVDYNRTGKYWLALRGEPNLSDCFHGSMDVLERAVQDTLAGKDVQVPTREPDKKEDTTKRREAVSEALDENRNRKQPKATSRQAADAGERGKVDLAKIERKIAKEPKYKGKPRYALMVFGVDASPCIWLVLDGDTLYVDRNGNGDLTEPGEKMSLKEQNTDPASFDQVEILAGDKVARKLDLWVYNWRGQDKDQPVHPALQVSDTKQRVYGAWGGWDAAPVWGPRPESAPIFHVGGPLEMGFEQPANLVFRKADKDMLELQVGVGTPGLGKGSFTHLKYWNDAIPEKAQPTALLEFPNKVRGGPPIKLEFMLKERC